MVKEGQSLEGSRQQWGHLLESGRMRTEKTAQDLAIRRYLMITVQGEMVQRPHWVPLQGVWRWGSTLIINNFIQLGNEEKETNRKVTWVERTVLFPFFLSFARWERINDIFRWKGITSLKILDREGKWWSKGPKRWEETALKRQLEI